MFIQTQDTPNPSTIKFLPGQTVLPAGTAEFKSPDSATGHSPLAERLFTLQGVTGVFFGKDFISVTKSGDTDWSMLKSMILAVLMDHFSSNQPILIETASTPETTNTGDEDEIVLQIKELIETRVRPSVMMDGGDIVFDSFEDGVVFLQLRGACSGCPSATMTLKSGIENMLKHFIPEVTEVQAIQDF